MQPIYCEIACIYSQSDKKGVIYRALLPCLKYTSLMRLLAITLLISFTTAGQNLRSGGALKPEQAIMDVRHYTINLVVDPEQQSIKGFTTVKMKLAASTPSIVLDFWHGLTTTAVTVNGKKPRSLTPIKTSLRYKARMHSVRATMT